MRYLILVIFLVVSGCAGSYQPKTEGTQEYLSALETCREETANQYSSIAFGALMGGSLASAVGSGGLFVLVGTYLGGTIGETAWDEYGTYESVSECMEDKGFN